MNRLIHGLLWTAFLAGAACPPATKTCRTSSDCVGTQVCDLSSKLCVVGSGGGAGGGSGGGGGAAGAAGGGAGGGSAGGGGTGGGSGLTFTVGGSVSGLGAGKSVVLQNNGADSLTVSATGAFTFVAAVASGSPYNVTVLTQPTEQTCVVANGSGMVAGNVSNVAVTCTTNMYTVGGTVSGLAGSQRVVLKNGSDNLTVSTNGPFTFPTPLASGGMYGVAVFIQPGGERCTVSGGAGTATAAVTNVVVTCAPLYGRYAYVANSGDNTLSIYSLDPATGQWRHRGYAPTGQNPVSVAVEPSGRFAYVANSSGVGSVSQYAIGVDGLLTPLSPATVVYTSRPVSVTVDPSGRYVYVGNNNSTISQYTIGLDGALGAMSPATVASAGRAFSIAIDPAGRFAYVLCASVLYQYSIGANGGLTLTNPTGVATGSNPQGVVIDPSGRFVYVASYASNDVSSYTVSAMTGALTSLGTVPAPGNPVAIAVDPSGRFVYVTTYTSNKVSAYTINDTTGALTSVGSVAAGTGPGAVTIDPSGAYAYVANNTSADVSAYTIAATTGALTPAGKVVTMTLPDSIAIARGAAPAVATPKYAYVANYVAGRISQYAVGSTGSLAPMTPTFLSGGAFTAVATDPAGRYVYASDFGAAVWQYSIGAAGGIAPLSPSSVSTGGPCCSGPQSLAVDALGAHVYVADSTANAILQFTTGPDGGLTAMSPASVAAGANPVSIVLDPSGQYAYAANRLSNNVSIYWIDVVSHALTNSGTFAAGVAPTSVAVHPSGRFAYVTSDGDSTIKQYAIVSGAVTTTTLAGGSQPKSIAFDPSGRYAYVANYGTGSVAQFAVDASGGLTPMSPPQVGVGWNPTWVVVDASGKYVYVTNANNFVSQFTIGTSGALVAMTPATAPSSDGASITTTAIWQ